MLVTDIIELEESGVDGNGCYCLRSKAKSNGYQNKNNWVKRMFQDGLKYVKIMEDGKPLGFIEYIPIEHSSRVVFGENYLVIHCLWVQVTGKGHASRLIQKCIQDAKEQKKNGIVVVTNSTTSWTPSKEIFLKNGFYQIDQAPGDFELLVYKLGESEDPYFPTDWKERLLRFEELTIFRTPQCPFLDIATDNVLEGATKLGIKATIIEIKDREELLKLSPTPYGVYGVVFKNSLLTYHRLTIHSAMKKLKLLL